ncbi:MAG: ribonuclease catalytic domain-containing protein [Oligoflexales bacterium]
MHNKQTMILNSFLAFSILISRTALSLPHSSKALMALSMMLSPGTGFFLPAGMQSQRNIASDIIHPLQISSAAYKFRPLYYLPNQDIDGIDQDLDIPKEVLQSRFLQRAISHGVRSEYFLDTFNEEYNLENRSLDFSGLMDLTSYSFVTIDNDHSKDLDQAVYIEYDSMSKNYRVYYAIADASYFSAPGTSLDKEASERVFTTYLPGFDIPIFPRMISENLCSLFPEKKRRALVIIMDFSADGVMHSKSFEHAIIESKAQLSFRRVQEYYDQGEAHPFAKEEYSANLDHLRSLGKALVQRAKERGAVDFAFREVSIRPNDVQSYYAISENVRYIVEKYNEQISVSSNRAVAEYFRENSLNSIHRFHPSTTGEKLELARSKLRELNIPWSHDVDMQTFVEKLRSKCILNDIAKSIACRSNLKAKYSGQYEQRGHEGLKVPFYDHFTAPMRRYTDIINHRILLAHLKGEPVPYQSNSKKLPRYLRRSYLERYASKANRARNREEQVKRSIDDYVSSLLLLPVKDEYLTATIMYVNDRGVSIRIENHPFDRWLSMDSLTMRTHSNIFTEGQSIVINFEESFKEGHWYLNPQCVL